MAEIAGAVGPISTAAAERVRQGRIRVGAASGLDLAAASERLEMLMKA
jgi:hypothetical protein